MSSPKDEFTEIIKELEINLKELLKELGQVKFKYQRLHAAAEEHAEECASAGTLRWTLRKLDSEEPR